MESQRAGCLEVETGCEADADKLHDFVLEQRSEEQCTCEAFKQRKTTLQIDSRHNIKAMMSSKNRFKEEEKY